MEVDSHIRSDTAQVGFPSHTDVAVIETIRKQFDFYFSDANLAKDQFLRQHIVRSLHAKKTHRRLAVQGDLSKNGEEIDVRGMIDLRVVAEFNRIRQLTRDFRCVREAARLCTALTIADVIVIDRTGHHDTRNSEGALHTADTAQHKNVGESMEDDAEKIDSDARVDSTTGKRRVMTLIGLVQPLPPFQLQADDKRSVYVEGLPNTSDHNTLREAFGIYGSVTHVSIPRFKDRSIKGFAFIEFETVDASHACAKKLTKYMPPRNAIGPDGDRHKGAPVILQAILKEEWSRLKAAYMKLQQEALGKLKRYQEANKSSADAANTHNNTQKTSVQPIESAYKGSLKRDRNSDTPGRTGDGIDTGASTRTANEPAYTKGLIVRLNNVNPNTRKNKLKTAFEVYGDVAFVDFTVGKTSAFIRFTNPKHVQDLLTNFKSVPEIQDDGKEVVVSLLDGEFEAQYWSKLGPKAKAAARQVKASTEVTSEESSVSKDAAVARTFGNADNVQGDENASRKRVKTSPARASVAETATVHADNKRPFSDIAEGATLMGGQGKRKRKKTQKRVHVKFDEEDSTPSQQATAGDNHANSDDKAISNTVELEEAGKKPVQPPQKGVQKGADTHETSGDVIQKSEMANDLTRQINS
ncbi:hypothetical protein SARC_09726 [Sphaeroforma arctica JP610]|uniref:RRM domain-containing protein n=1 Tax=Sphaeroforma arctica JP610 TaxID=667725 RepID=A0A0L0FPC3_9EUKA|nr:hypothetical protein SARC_09726 [Sphaeroforma arctica JP610]KNC77823.1 hypothetical protein SARC_09726 [Sphaeroforma arctica JP610]|eukprot:XP_014151725.1 hypothetical protein SARC_09726 [Sphaeroforma arctica JP610]